MATAAKPEEIPVVEAIESQIQRQGIRTNKDVTELYLAHLNFTSVPELDAYRNLQVLRLNGNRLRSTSFLRSCQRLTELYLQDNKIYSIAGTMSHLTCLKVLSLHRNQLVKLEQVVKEFAFMQCLERLNLAENPLSQESDYRHYVIFQCPSLEIFDRLEVAILERREARKAYDQDQELIRDRLAFGRRAEGPPAICYPAQPPVSTPSGPKPRLGDSFFRDNLPYPNLDSAAEARRSKTSLVEFTHFDWSKIPRSAAQRLQKEKEVHPELVTVRLKI